MACSVGEARIEECDGVKRRRMVGAATFDTRLHCIQALLRMLVYDAYQVKAAC